MNKTLDITVRVPVFPGDPSPEDIALAVYSACLEFNGTVFKPFGETAFFFLNKAEVVNVTESQSE